MANAKKHCVVNGQLLAADSFNLSVFDHGFTVGDGVFETLKIENGQPFALTRHLARLERSAQIIKLPTPDVAAIRGDIARLIEVDGDCMPSRARLRLTYTAGVGPLGSDRFATDPTVAIVWDELSSSAPTAQLAITPWPRPTSAAALGAKTTSYIENVLALRVARDRGCSEALLLNDLGRVCEGTGSNIFVVSDGHVVTPPLSEGCLAGVTRELAIEWFQIQERPVSRDELLQAEEVFLTSTTRDIQPVDSIDEIDFVAPGPISSALSAQFVARAKADPDP
jgi:branched-chain amino acid aminotransferase